MTASEETSVSDELIDQVPSHVPRDLIHPFSVFDNPDMQKCPYAAMSKLHEQPDIFWSPLSNRGGKEDGGSWVVTRADDIARILGDPLTFSSKSITGFSKLIGDSWDMLPLEVDPPSHTKYRNALSHFLYPKVVAAMAPGISRRAHDLIDQIADKNGCEFMSAFGKPFPVSIFMQLMGLPSDRMDIFLSWVKDLLHGDTIPQRQAAALEIKAYLLDLMNNRRNAPKDDLATKIVNAEIDGRLWNDDEVLGTFYTFFVGGMDSVAATLGWFFRHLAEHPEQQQFLRDNRSEIGHAAVELMRRYTITTSVRHCVRDTEINGVQIKAGDWLTIPYPLGSLDPSKFENPMEVDFSRKQPRHFSFASGPHFCMGSHLAMKELTVAMETWFDRIPPFRLKKDAKVEVYGDVALGVARLELEW